MPLILKRTLVCSIVFFGWSIHLLRADDALDIKVFSMASQYEGLRIRGTITAFTASETKPSQQFELVLGYPKDAKQARPFSLSFMVPNPGEPHLSQDELVDVADLSDGFIAAAFTRSYVTASPSASRYTPQVTASPSASRYTTHVTASPPALRYSEMELRLHRAQRLETEAILRALQYWVDGRDSLGNASDSSALRSYMNFTDEGKEDYLGIETHLLSFSIPHASATLRVALEPTVQIIECVKTSPNALSFDVFDRKVESVKVFDCVLLPINVTLMYGREEKTDGFRVEVESVEKIDRDYPGLWKFNDLTGVVISGDPGLVNQLVSVGVPQGRFQREIPYSPEEEELIRRYVLANTSVVNQPTSWRRIAFYAVNLAAALVLIYAVWRKARYAN